MISMHSSLPGRDSRPQAVPVRVATLYVIPMLKSLDGLQVKAISMSSSSAGHHAVPLAEAAGHLWLLL